MNRISIFLVLPLSLLSCAGEPKYAAAERSTGEGSDPPGRESCEAIEAEYMEKISSPAATECRTAGSRCQVIKSHCDSGLGGCHVSVNATIRQEELDAIAARWVRANCRRGGCRCAAPPEEAWCVEGSCRFPDD